MLIGLQVNRTNLTNYPLHELSTVFKWRAQIWIPKRIAINFTMKQLIAPYDEAVNQKNLSPGCKTSRHHQRSTALSLIKIVISGNLSHSPFHAAHRTVQTTTRWLVHRYSLPRFSFSHSLSTHWLNIVTIIKFDCICSFSGYIWHHFQANGRMMNLSLCFGDVWVGCDMEKAFRWKKLSVSV